MAGNRTVNARRVDLANRRGARLPVRVKRVYDEPDAADGTRVLVDRLWPGGISRDQVAADLWLKEAAPSEALRKWYGHDPNRWESFRRKYRSELARRGTTLRLLRELRRHGPLTLIYGARDIAHNNAVVLREVVEDGAIEA
jgi:uncharacterized protein YeaO (DUF488 family)